MIVSIHQSQYMPWPAYFRKIALSDIFVVMDDVQFQKNGVQNRNKIRNKNGEFWLTVPVSGNLNDKIKDKKIADKKWQKKHFQSLSQSYAKTPYWKDYCAFFNELFQGDIVKLHDVNNAFIYFVLEELDIKTKIVQMSSLNCKGEKSELVKNICLMLDAKTYLSGEGGRSYLDLDSFADSGIHIDFMASENPVYQQIHGEFIPNLSILDMLFNVNKETVRKYLYKKESY